MVRVPDTSTERAYEIHADGNKTRRGAVVPQTNKFGRNA